MATAADSPATTACTLLSTCHGRDRRELRKIDKKDLTAAVLHGKKERSHSGRWKYTYANIVYITDQSSRFEVTSYVLPTQIHKALLSDDDWGAHEAAAWQRREYPASCTSHTILVVDQSGSMRTCDVENFRTRSDAVFATMALDLVGRQIDQHALTLTDVVSLIEMRDVATTVLEREPITNVLYNKMLRLKKDARPSHAGNYIPALKEAARIMDTDRDNRTCALLLVFLSDGRPSDNGQRIEEQMHQLAQQFGSQLTVGTIGFGASQGEFQVLKTMADSAHSAGSHGAFTYSGQCSVTLSTAISSLGSRLSATRSRITALTALAGSRQGREQRPQRQRDSPPLQHRSAAAAAAARESINTDEWWLYTGNTTRICADWGGKSRGWVSGPICLKDSRAPTHPNCSSAVVKECSVAVRIDELGRGAERVVFELRLFDYSPAGAIVPIGEKLVAKESAFVEDDCLNKEFHYVFCKTQQQAGRFARKFNERIASAFALQRWLVPATISFLSCSVYELYGSTKEEYLAVLVEKMLDRSKWTKWNNNAGHVFGAASSPPGVLCEDEEKSADSNNEDEAVEYHLPVIMEESDSENGDEDFAEHQDHVLQPRHPPGKVKLGPIVAEDFPQAFSHYTHRYSQRASLVCDLQGTLDTSVFPAVFELTDPVIHHASMRGRQRVYGRTDHGQKGMQQFFRSHQCNALCRALGLPSDY